MPEWISVKDKMPEDGERIIANSIAVGDRFACVWVTWGNRCKAPDIYGVTHWMPLPDPIPAPQDEESPCND